MSSAVLKWLSFNYEGLPAILPYNIRGLPTTNRTRRQYCSNFLPSQRYQETFTSPPPPPAGLYRVASLMLSWDFLFCWSGRNADEAGPGWPKHIENISCRMSRAFIEWKFWSIFSFSLAAKQTLSSAVRCSLQHKLSARENANSSQPGIWYLYFITNIKYFLSPLISASDTGPTGKDHLSLIILDKLPPSWAAIEALCGLE